MFVPGMWGRMHLALVAPSMVPGSLRRCLELFVPDYKQHTCKVAPPSHPHHREAFSAGQGLTLPSAELSFIPACVSIPLP